MRVLPNPLTMPLQLALFAKSHKPNLTKYNLWKSFMTTFWWVFSTLTIKTMDVVINSLQGN